MVGRLSVALLVVGLVVAGVGVAMSAQQARPAAAQCSLTGKGAFDIGWTEEQQNQHFKCVATFDPALKQSGAAWVRVDAAGKVQIP